jgi:hypothetical protein
MNLGIIYDHPFLSTMKDDLLNVFVKELIKIKKNCTTKKS